MGSSANPLGEPAEEEENSFQNLPCHVTGTLERGGSFLVSRLACTSIDCQRLLLFLGGIFFPQKDYKQLPLLCVEHVIAVEINKILFVLLLLFLLLDALNFGHFCSLWQWWLPHGVGDQK